MDTLSTRIDMQASGSKTLANKQQAGGQNRKKHSNYKPKPS